MRSAQILAVLVLGGCAAVPPSTPNESSAAPSASAALSAHSASAASSASAGSAAASSARAGAPAAAAALGMESFEAWHAHIALSADELAWESLPWLPSYAEGLAAAQQQRRPLLLWVMNGHPLGCT